jgi:hypothetical protein
MVPGADHSLLDAGLQNSPTIWISSVANASRSVDVLALCEVFRKSFIRERQCKSIRLKAHILWSVMVVRLVCPRPRCAAARLESFVARLYLDYLWTLTVAVVNDIARIEAAESCPIAGRPTRLAPSAGQNISAHDVDTLGSNRGFRSGRRWWRISNRRRTRDNWLQRRRDRHCRCRCASRAAATCD